MTIDQIPLDENGLTPLHRAARDTSDAEIIRSLIANGADVHAKDTAGRTPLHWAAGCNPNIDVAKCLIEHGADVRLKDDNGCTPFAVAFKLAKSDEVGLYFMDQMIGSKGVEVTDPVQLEEIKRRFDKK